MRYKNIPNIKNLYDPILHYLETVTQARTGEVREAVANHFYMDDEDRALRASDDRRYPIFHNRVNSACATLCDAGLIVRLRRGFYRITPKAQTALEQNYYFDRDYIKQNIDDSEKKHGDDAVPPAPKVYHEFCEEKDLTLEAVWQLRKQNVRFANMLRYHQVVLSDGKLMMMAKPISRIQCASESEYLDKVKANAVEDLKVFKDTESSAEKVVSSREAHRNNKSGKPPWNDYHHFDNKPSQFSDFIEKLKKTDSFGKALELLVKEYGIKKKELAKRLGISQNTMNNFVKDIHRPKEVRIVFAIALIMNLRESEVRILLKRIGADPDCETEPSRTYLAIFETCAGMKQDEINEICDKNNISRIF